jgi:hypothetical protein
VRRIAAGIAELTRRRRAPHLLTIEKLESAISTNDFVTEI